MVPNYLYTTSYGLNRFDYVIVPEGSVEPVAFIRVPKVRQYEVYYPHESEPTIVVQTLQQVKDIFRCD